MLYLYSLPTYDLSLIILVWGIDALGKLFSLLWSKDRRGYSSLPEESQSYFPHLPYLIIWISNADLSPNFICSTPHKQAMYSLRKSTVISFHHLFFATAFKRQFGFNHTFSDTSGNLHHLLQWEQKEAAPEIWSWLVYIQLLSNKPAGETNPIKRHHRKQRKSYWLLVFH